MICRTCQRAARLAPSQRFFSTTRASLNATPISSAATPTPRQAAGASPAATSSASSAQPFSAPLTPSPSPALEKAAAKAAAAAEKKATPLVKSSVPAGTPLKGLNFEKNKQDPVARPDDEYPAWLWTILQRQEGGKGDVGAVGDLFSKSKKQRRLAAKRLRKEQAMNPELLTPKIPLTEQTIDLPAGDGSLEGAVEAAGARGELTKAMRDKRRAGIKEANFLKAMG